MQNTKMLSLDLIRVTEGAALASFKEIGRGDKLRADEVATIAARERLNKIDFCGQVVLGEGIKDESYGIFKGELVGLFSKGTNPQFDIVIDPLEGTNQAAKFGPEAMSVIAVGNKGSLFASECFYMKKMAFFANGASIDIDINDKKESIIANLSRVKNKHRSDLTICMLDRPRNEPEIKEFRKLGCKLKLIPDCDVSAAIATCIPNSSVDMYYGIGGCTEGILSAVALKALRGNFQGILVEKDGSSIDGKVYNIEDLAKGDVIFCATAVTDGDLLRGVRHCNGKYKTHSVLMRSESGTVRFIRANHGN